MNKLQRTLAPLVVALLVSPGSQAEDLVEIYRAALESDPVLSAQQSAFEAVTESQQQAKSIYRPNISFNADYTKTNSDVDAPAGSSSVSGDFDFDVISYDLTLLQPLYRRDYITQLNQAVALTRQAEADLNQAYQDIILRVSQRYFDVLSARDSLEFAQAEKSAISRQLDQAKQRFEVGLIAITDVHEAQAAYDLATASEIVAQNTLATSRLTLLELTGQLPQKLAGLNEKMELVTPDPANLDAWVEASLQNNFNLIAAEAATEASMQGLKQERANRQPKLDLFAKYGVDDYSGSTATEREETNTTLGLQFTVPREETNTTLGLQFTVPLYQGGGISAGIKRANAELMQARDALEQQRRATQREASDAYLSVLAGISQVKALKQAVTSSESALNATEAGYDVGTRTTVDVLNVRRELFRTQRDYARARYDYVLASLRLKQAAGTLSAEDIERINRWMIN